jgi:hypothetical protein
LLWSLIEEFENINFIMNWSSIIGG